MNQSRRRILTLGTAVAVSGCLGTDTQSSRPSTDRTTTPEPSPDERTGSNTQVTTEARRSPTETCEEPTPRPVPDVKVGNERDRAVSARITIRKTTDDTGGALHESNRTIDPGSTVDIYDVFTDTATYRFDVELANGTTTATDIETEPSRHSVISIRIEDDGSIEIEQLNVAPPPTPTPCP